MRGRPENKAIERDWVAELTEDIFQDILENISIISIISYEMLTEDEACKYSVYLG